MATNPSDPRSGKPAQPRPAVKVPHVRVAPPKKSRAPLFIALLILLLAGGGAAYYFLRPKQEPLTKAQLYALQKEAEAREAALRATPVPEATPTPAPKVAVATPAPTPVATPMPATPAPVAMATPAPATPKPQSEIEKWLTQVETTFQESYAREVQGPYDTAMGEIRRAYRAALDQHGGAAGAAGKMEEATAWREERQRFFDDGQKVPPDNSDNPLPAIQPLRAGFRAQAAKFEADRLARARAHFAKLDAALSPAIAQLTQKQRLEDAQLLKAKREEIQKAWIGTTAPSALLADANRPKPTTVIPPRPTIKKYPRGDDRKAAEWVLNVGGTIEIMEGGKPKRITKVADLPKQRFSLSSVRLNFTGEKEPTQPIENLEPLAELDDLVDVEVNRLPLKDEHLAPLTTLSKLGRLGFEGTAITDEAIGYFTLMPKLHSLRIQGNKGVQGRRLEELAGTDVKELSLQSCSIVPEAWPHLAKLKKLTRLNVRYTNIRDGDLQHLGELTGLDQLYLNRTEVTASGLQALKALRDVRDFGWDFTSGKGREELAEVARIFPRTTNYNLDGATNTYTEADVQALEAFRELRGVHLYGKTIDDKAVLGLDALKGLKVLRFSSGTAITDQTLGHLAGHKGIEELGLGDVAGITDAGLLKLQPMKGLKRLELRACAQITPAGIAAFQKARPDVAMGR